MRIDWKKGKNRFRPEIILRKIDSIRTVTPDGKVSFSGFEIEYYLPALHSMLDFNQVASEADISNLVWRGLAKVKSELTPDSFLISINEELKNQLATREQTYNLLTSISLDNRNLPKKIVTNGTEIHFLSGDYPTKFSSRDELIRTHPVPVATPPTTYCHLVIKTKAKSPAAAVNKSLRSIDLIRAIWCSIRNPQMQLAFGNAALSPINVIRLGSIHTLHLEDGSPATDTIWFDPGFKEASIFRMEDSEVVKLSLKVLRQITTSPYSEKISTSLIRYVRAFDESDPNTAFLRLWGALEMLVAPSGQTDYAKLVQRCAFLFNDSEFHRQLLEHLREYRNANVHAGEESEQARTHCYQLQIYFVALLSYHWNNFKLFQSLDEANMLLDFPTEIKDLKRRLQLVNKALRYRTPKVT